MKDAALTLTKALPNAAANNNSAALDLNPEAAGFLTNQWRIGYFAITMPALASHTNTSTNITLKLQDSVDNSNFADTDPVIQAVTTGVASTGSVARTVKMPLPPGVRRYVRFNQTADANSNTGPNSNIVYDLVV